MRALLVATTLVCVATAAGYEPYANYTEPIISVLDDALHFLTSDANVTNSCRNSTSLLIEGAGDGATWALRFIDAAGKPSSGLLGPTVFMPGSFGECIGATMRNGVSGKYCLMSTGPLEKANERKGHPWNALNNNILNIGLCLPSTCTDEDIKRATRSVISNGTKVDIGECYTNYTGFLEDPAAIAMTAIICLVGLIVFVATVYDVIREPERPIQCYLNKASSLAVISTETAPVTTASSEILCEKRKPPTKSSRLGDALLSFSLIANGKKILQVEKTEGSIDALHGMRFLSMAWIITGHSISFALQWLFMQNPSNPNVLTIDFGAQILANGTVSVDTFFFLSGFLVTYLSLKKMKKSEGKLNFVEFYLHRYIRMTPVMMAIIGFCACILRYVSKGPRWLTAIQMYDTWCKKNWWLNLLYVQNFFDTTNMCLSHTWYSAVDMQFYIISPFIIYALFKWKRGGLSVVAVLMAASIAITAVLTAIHQYPAIPYIAPIVAPEHMNDYYKTVYIKPYCRIGPYLVGMLLGYIMYNRSDQATLSRYWVIIGWTSCIATNLFVIYIMWPANKGILPTVSEATIYGSLARTVWAVTLAWIVFACITGHGGFINTFLSWRMMIPLSRLTYSAYLIHPVLMAIFYGSREIVFSPSVYFLCYLIFGNLVMGYVVSFFLSLFFESPIIGLEKTLRRKT